VDQRALVKVKEAIRLKENLHEVIAWQHSRPSVESACSMQSAEPSPERKSRLSGAPTPPRGTEGSNPVPSSGESAANLLLRAFEPSADGAGCFCRKHAG